MRITIVIVAVCTLCVTTPDLAAQDRNITSFPLVGWVTGGTSFSRTCPRGSVLTGLRWRAGYQLDAVGIMCSRVHDNGQLGPSENVGTMAGGNGGRAGSDTCRGGVVAGQTGAAQVTGGVALFYASCFRWYAASRSWGGSFYTVRLLSTNILPALGNYTCSDGQRPVIGIYGRHGAFIDALGLRCGLP
jgi:hypothetical protein